MPIRRNIDKYVALHTYPLLVASHGKSLLLLGVGVDGEGRGVEDGLDDVLMQEGSVALTLICADQVF